MQITGTMQKSMAVVLGLALLGVVVFIRLGSETPAPPPDIPFVKTFVIGSDASSEQQFTYSGEVRGRYESHLGFLVSGRIIRRDIELGACVRKGEVLFELDPSDFRQGAAAARAQLKASKSQLELNRDNLERYRRLHASGVISKFEFDQRKLACDMAQAQFNQAQSQSNVNDNQLAYSRLRAPAGGVVAAIHAEEGQVVAAGQPVVSLVTGHEREVEINLPENRQNALVLDSTCTIKVWALPGLELKGRVREIAPMADPITRTYRARISLLDVPPELKLGMTATVSVSQGAQARGVYLPVAAVFQTGSQPSVWLVSQGRASLRPVKLGELGEGDRIRIVEGLQPGDVVVAAGVHKLRAGQKVRSGDGAL